MVMRERDLGVKGLCCQQGPHSPVPPPGLRQGLQGLPVERNQWASVASRQGIPTLRPLLTYLLSLGSWGPDHNLQEWLHEMPSLLLRPTPALLCPTGPETEAWG